MRPLPTFRTLVEARARGRSALVRPVLVGVVAVVLAIIAASPNGIAATSGSSVGVTVLSATSLTVAGCPSGTSGITDFGAQSVGAAATSSADCVVTFGSSNDTASLRMFQTDGRGAAMFQPTNGQLDTGFDGDGIASVNLGSTTDESNAVAVQADGKLVVVGSTSNGSDDDVAIVRFNENGTLDASFGTGGVTKFAVGSAADRASGVVVQPDGRIIVGGDFFVGATGRPWTARLTSTGALDPSYGTSGISRTTASASVRILDVVAQADGKTLLVGNVCCYKFFVQRLLADGAVDTTFGVGGSVEQAVAFNDGAQSAVVYPDGRILLAGYGTTTGTVYSQLVRLGANGALDPTFDGDGRLITSQVAGDANASRPVALQSDGKLLVVGDDFVVTRLFADGSLDTTFATGGSYSNPAYVGVNTKGIMIQDDGSLLAWGIHTNGFASIRLTAAGALDTSYGTGGLQRTLVGGGIVHPYRPMVAAAAADGRIVMTSPTNVGGGNGDFTVLLLGSRTFSQFASGSSDWSTPGTGLFGACLRTYDSGAAVDGTTWTADSDSTGDEPAIGADCGDGNGDPWRPVVATAATPGSVVARTAAASTTSATARIRFGLRVTASQPSGRYVAPVTFEVAAPG